MKRTIIAGALGAAAFSSMLAMAASLGGITTDDLGADNTVIASCDTNGITATYTVAYDGTTDDRNEVTAVNLTGIAAGCDTQAITVTLADSAGASLASGTATADALGSKTVTITSPPNAEAVEQVHIVITG